jgi:hypothetical protein
VLVIDDTAVPKKGEHSVGIAAQYASALGKTANCQPLVSLTLARGEVPVMIALRLFLAESWTSDAARLKRAGVPVEYRTPRSKPRSLWPRLIARWQPACASVVCWRTQDTASVRRFDKGSRHALGRWHPRHLKVYPVDVKLIWPVAMRGRPRKRSIPDLLSRAAEDMLADFQVAKCELAKRDQGSIESPVCRRSGADRRWSSLLNRFRQGCVRFTPSSGHWRATPACPPRAQ